MEELSFEDKIALESGEDEFPINSTTGLVESEYKQPTMKQITMGYLPSNTVEKTIPKGMKELKEVENHELEDSYGRRYWRHEDGSLRRVK